MNTLGQLISADPRVADIVTAWGIPYCWGSGRPSTPWPPHDADCSGFVQMALVRLGYLSPTYSDRTAHDLVMDSAPIIAGTEILGDLAFYGKGRVISHVMLCLGPGVVFGASGGTESTRADDPKAFVKIDRTHYRPDFVCIGRLKPDKR